VGIFDFLKRKKTSPPDEGEGPSTHYALAHLALRGFALAQPVPFLAIAASPDAGRLIQDLMSDVEKACGRPMGFKADEVKLHRVRVKAFPSVVVELPPPTRLAEAHLTALVAFIDLTSNERPDPKDVTGRYFTLEKSVRQSGTVLAEWTESQHLNYGEGPRPTVEDFVAALAEHV
jgi:hypothetical protein